MDNPTAHMDGLDMDLAHAGNTIQQQAERISELEANSVEIWHNQMNRVAELDAELAATRQQLAEVVEYVTKQNAAIKYLQNEFSTAGGGAVVYTREMRKRAIKDALALPLPKAMQG